MIIQVRCNDCGEVSEFDDLTAFVCDCNPDAKFTVLDEPHCEICRRLKTKCTGFKRYTIDTRDGVFDVTEICDGEISKC